jgi:hypothetical protein
MNKDNHSLYKYSNLEYYNSLSERFQVLYSYNTYKNNLSSYFSPFNQYKKLFNNYKNNLRFTATRTDLMRNKIQGYKFIYH